MVSFWKYPNPEELIFTSISLPLETTGVIIAPLPLPLTIKVGDELYSLPEFCIKTSIILPWLDTIGRSSAPVPLLISMFGFLIKLIIVDDP